TTTTARLTQIGELSRGFVYYVSRLGVTGAQRDLPAQLAEEVERVRTATKLPVAVGFGISTSAHAKAVAHFGDGVVVGSAFVDRIAKASTDAERIASVKTLARELVAGVRA
ncbi:MAG: tryptophan synthase subunit alpha, partial [Clostridia bacterium]|nr:tryptophan synthase subunit alpha [Deltaproteobacteria bacterium]